MRVFVVLTLCLVAAAYLTGFSTSALQDAVLQEQTAIVARTVIVGLTVAVVTFLVLRRWARPSLLAAAAAAVISYVLFPGTWYAETMIGEAIGNGLVAQTIDGVAWTVVVLSVAVLLRRRRQSE